MATIADKSRFKFLKVKVAMSIRDFAAKNKLEFKPGRGFYQLTKPETIQIYKEIVARRKTDGTFVTGDALRKILGMPTPTDGKAKFKLDRTKLADFDIFIQSTSYNRKLLANTDFLYETHGKGITGSDRAAAKEVAEVRLTDFTIPEGGFKDKFKPPAPTGGPGSPIDIVFCFDTTGSMSSCIMEVRKRVQEVIERLLGDIPNIRISVFAHGDYCDTNTYVTKWVDFSKDQNALCKFVKSVGATGGGDYPECYELALHQIRTKLSWRGGSQRSVVMIGDAIPHGPDEKQNYLSLDWRVEASLLQSQLGSRIYAVQCNKTSGAGKMFWKGMATITHGNHLHLEDFATIIDFIMAICYRERGAEYLETFEKEIRSRELKRSPGSGLNSELHNLFASLKSGSMDDKCSTPGDTSAIDLLTGGASVAVVAKAVVGKKRKAITSAVTTSAKKTKKIVKKSPAKKTPAKKATVKKTTARKKTPSKKITAKKSVKKAPAEKATVKKTPTKRSPPIKAVKNKPAIKKPIAKKTPMKKGSKSKKGRGKK